MLPYFCISPVLQIARSLVIFNVDEVIVFNESSNKDNTTFKGSTKASDPNILLARILQYLECPQYLRKYLFPKHPDLQYAGMCNRFYYSYSFGYNVILYFQDKLFVNMNNRLICC